MEAGVRRQAGCSDHGLVSCPDGDGEAGSPRAQGTSGPGGRIAVEVLTVVPKGRIEVLEEGRDDDVETLLSARVVVGVGAAVPPEEYESLQPLLKLLGAELAGSRKVTDKGWLPRARQVGITGHSVAPALYVALGVQGKFNHVIGTRSAGTVLAVNLDAASPDLRLGRPRDRRRLARGRCRHSLPRSRTSRGLGQR